MHEYLMKACQDDALRAGERDRQLLEARRVRKAGRNHQEPAAPVAAVVQVRRLTRLMWRLRFRGSGLCRFLQAVSAVTTRSRAP